MSQLRILNFDVKSFNLVVNCAFIFLIYLNKNHKNFSGNESLQLLLNTEKVHEFFGVYALYTFNSNYTNKMVTFLICTPRSFLNYVTTEYGNINGHFVGFEIKLS